MISVENAKKLVRKNTKRLSIEKKKLLQAIGDVAAEDMRAPRDLPLFDNSAMDGYVFNSLDVKKASQKNPVFLKIQGVIRAGDTKKRVLKKGGVYKIMTGAMTPGGADTVCIQEEAVVTKGCLVLKQPVFKGAHIRRQGEEIQKGSKISLKYSWIHPGMVGFLASFGTSHIRVFRKPLIVIMTTGHELRSPGQKLPKGCIYDSNSTMIQAALKNMNLTVSKTIRVKDTKTSINTHLKRALLQSDVVIITGGVSVGEYDYVKSALKALRVKEIFWKVSQKPGKPLYVGKKDKTLVFGLPGNPASVFTCFYEYVYPALQKMRGCQNPELVQEKVRMDPPVRYNSKKHLFLKGLITKKKNKKTVKILAQQGSHMMSSLCSANVFVSIPPQKKNSRPQKDVVTQLLPYTSEGDLS